ncbi:hypothetical protein KVT40_002835 [Elsinoe batatas]|uniref:Uncharacterized protein n=1 Tax=Elsinoe batatas TaxID=2601811 RepID=A0A8K0L4W3_9PEZI|nr:hypothetical protein KVT40_002835 [Elsinoe batatas]
MSDRWPGSDGFTSDKAPTIIEYVPGADLLVGYEVSANPNAIVCAKLALDTRQDFPEWVSRADLTARLDAVGKSAEDAVRDYFTRLRKTAIEELTKRGFYKQDAPAEIRWVMTIPAVWSDAARQKTLDAAKAAGIGPKIQTISEPEAAAVHTFATLQNKDLKIGDVYIVCDAGGGTVDLITLEVTRLDPMQFREVVPGEGGLCGSAFINFGFENLMKTKFGPNEFHKFRKRSPKQLKVVMDNFDQSIKRSFDMSKARNRRRKFELPFPGMPDNSTIGIDGGMLSLTSEEIENMFEPVCRDVLLLIQRQFDAATRAGHAPSGILVVGGLGRSPYLLDRINERFIGTLTTAGIKRDYDQMTEDRALRPANRTMTLLKSADAWTAVVRGAALGGMADVELVTSRKARRNYGVRTNTPWDPSKHSPWAKYWDNAEAKWKARGLLRIYKLCSINIPCAKIPRQAFQKMENSEGNTYTYLKYDLGMHVGSGELRFDFRIDGKVLGHIDARFD